MRLESLSDLSDSAIAQAMQADKPGRFPERLEAVYLQQHLRFARPHVRIWFTLSALLTIILTPLQPHHPGALPAIHLTVHVLSVLTLCALAWSPLYFRCYLPAARVLVPVYQCGVAIFISDAMMDGQGQQLANLAVTVFGNYFLAGLLPFAAIFSSAAVVVTFAINALVSGMPPPLMGPGLVTLSITLALGAMVTRDIGTNRRRRFLERALIAELVARDALSGLKNRRAFDEQLLCLWQEALREGRALALLLIDIDHFKNYNDVHGHQAGDAALRAVAQILKEYARRPADMAARYGGEEFALILPDVPAHHARELAEHARQAVASMATRELESNGDSPVTVSIGVAHLTPADHRTPEGAIQLADEALYQAKANGRNCVIFKGEQDYGEVRTGQFRAARAAAS